MVLLIIISCMQDMQNLKFLVLSRIEDIPELFVVGKPHMTVVAFGSNAVDIFEVNDLMSSKGWHLNALQRPNRQAFFLTQHILQRFNNYVSYTFHFVILTPFL